MERAAKAALSSLYGYDMRKNWRSFLALLLGVFLMVLSLYRVLELLTTQDLNGYNAGRIVGNSILLIAGFLICRVARKKSGGPKL
jgi:hypothetical protein